MTNQAEFGDDLPESPGGSPVGLLGIYALLGYALLLVIFVFYSLVKVWPPIPEREKQGNENASVSVPAGNNANRGGNQNSSGNTNSNQGGNANGAGNSNAIGSSNTNVNAALAEGANANTTANVGNTTSAGNTTANVSGGNTNANTGANANANTQGNANAGTSKGGPVPATEICLDPKGNPRPGWPRSVSSGPARPVSMMRIACF